MEPSTLTPKFMEGFVERCLQHGLTASETEDLFRKQANNIFLARPGVHRGLTEGLAKAKSRFTKSALISYTHPDVLSAVVDCRIHFGDDAMSVGIRKEAGLPAPDPSALPEELQEMRTKLASMVQGFSQLPLNQQVLISMLAGGGLNAASRALRPTPEDNAMGHGTGERVMRGFGRGAMTGGGAALGAHFGADAAQRMFQPMHGQNNARFPMAAGGALLGGMAGNHMAGML